MSAEQPASAPDLKEIRGEMAWATSTRKPTRHLRLANLALRHVPALCDYAERLSEQVTKDGLTIERHAKDIFYLRAELAASREECQRMRPVIAAAENMADGLSIGKPYKDAREQLLLSLVIFRAVSRGDNPQ